MQFKHPEILYALVLLIIPIIVHLFQLQRFSKIPFTNVQFLKKIVQQTRKSSQLKKWLILTTRLLTFTCLIFAFSQPYFSKHELQQDLNTTLYLDNSFSMKAKGENGELLKSATQKIIDYTSNKTTPISIITNTNYIENLSQENLKNELINIEYVPYKADLNTILNQINTKNLTKTNNLNKIVLISDFQNINFKNKIDFTNVNSNISLLKLTPNNQNNIYIDSIFFSEENAPDLKLNVIVKSVFKNSKSVPVSLFEESKLVGKASVTFNNNTSEIVQFSIPKTSNFEGKISLTDEVLTPDNDFYFTISKPEKLNILCIGKTTDFLAKIYTEKEFNFNSVILEKLNYNSLKNQQLILLNELDYIPIELQKAIYDFIKSGGNLVVIPSNESDLNSYNQFFKTLKIGKINSPLQNNYKVITINYEHPLLKGVFEKKVTNFQYPTTNLIYPSQLINSASVLALNNNQPFISSIEINQQQFIYWVASPLNTETSDFQKSSLIVPIFYNFATHGLQFSKLYYNIKPNLTIDIKTSIGKDDVLKIANSDTEFIPLQKVLPNNVTIELQNQIIKSGIYSVLNNTKTIQKLALNYNKEESNLTYKDLNTLQINNENVTISTSIEEIFDEISNEQKINWLFKWFLAFSILFLCIEMLILKYFKI